MASLPRTYRPHCLAKNERNEAMIADYLGGMSRAQVAGKYGIGRYRLNKIFYNHRVVLPEDERSRRIRYSPRPASPGRPRIWPDCPPELAADYMLFRRKGLRAAEARALLDPGFQA